MKTCSVCGVDKELKDYYFKNSKLGKLHAQCKNCYSEKRKLFRQEHYLKYGDAYRERARIRKQTVKKIRQEQLYDYLSDKQCEICGMGDLRVLDFDHVDPKSKKFSIARAVNDGTAWEIIAEEIKKCRILCANCHRIRTAEQFSWRKMARWPSG